MTDKKRECVKSENTDCKKLRIAGKRRRARLCRLSVCLARIRRMFVAICVAVAARMVTDSSKKPLFCDTFLRHRPCKGLFCQRPFSGRPKVVFGKPENTLWAGRKPCFILQPGRACPAAALSIADGVLKVWHQEVFSFSGATLFHACPFWRRASRAAFTS